MKTGLLRTGSIPVQHLTRSDSGSFNQTRSIPSSPCISFRSRINNNNGFGGIRRSISDTNMVMSEYSLSKVIRVRSVSFADMSVIVEDELKEENGIGLGNGSGKGNHNLGGGGNYNYNYNNNNNEKSKLKEYYLKLLKHNPCDSLILRNYAKYLHEVENNTEKAEEYYGRAILASPGDGELLSLYGNLIWETQRDQHRARSYFDQALHSSPHDSTVLGSYAHFLWETEDEDDEEEEMKQENVVSPTMVGAY
ncbi:uncharacterized protein LOC141644360 [Silene latifolia]|uniref:uncharacterized protein LOC141644360 n=1 Tax=Silene latifolia TaxID=37657 RepID=UPI003D7738E2